MNERLRKLIDERAHHWNEVQDIRARLERENRDLTDLEERKLVESLNKVDNLSRLIEQEERAAGLEDSLSGRAAGGGSDLTANVAASARGREFTAGAPLQRDQRMSEYVSARGLVQPGQEGLSFGRYVRGLLTGDWAGAEDERRALVEGTATAGGHLVPTPLSARIIDRARNEARVFQAGAQVVPMEAQTLKIARITGDPTAAWHSEMATIAASDMTFDAVTLTARALASRVLISRELIEDADGVDDEVERAFAQQFALTVDLAALYGSGTAPEPRGVKNVAAVTKTALGANGGNIHFDALIDSVYRVRAANHEPTAQIMAPRSAQTLAKQKGGDMQYLTPPPALAGIRRLTTNQVPTNLTQGTATNASDIFTADWSELLIGVRTSLEITVLRERSMDVGAYELLAWWRGDIAVARPAAFDVVTGAIA